jgi:predicted RND superfamily exporter protein
MSLEGPKLIDRQPDTLVRAPGWAVWLTRLRWVPALLAALLCAAAWPVSRQLPLDPTNDAFIIRDSFSWYEYGRFSRVFAPEGSIAVGIRFPQPLDAASASLLIALEKELADIPGVAAVHGLGGIERHRLKWFGQMEEKPLFEKLLAGKETPEAFLASRAHWPPPAPQLVSGDGRTAAVVLTLTPRNEDSSAADPGAALDHARRALDRLLPAGTETFLTGTVLEQRTFGHQIDRDRETFVPLCVAVIVGLLVLFHLDLRTVLYSLGVMGGALTLTEAVMSLTGGRMHAVTALLAPVVLIVAVSSTIKACGIFDLTREDTDRGLRVAKAMRGMFAPCFLANLTTFIGFLSLLVSRVPAVRDFGLYGAAGTAAAWALTMLGAPLFAAWRRPKHRFHLTFFERIGHGIAWVSRHLSWLIVAAAVAFAALAVREIPRIHTSTDLLKIFKPEDPFRRDTERFMEQLGGVYPLEVQLEAPAPSVVRTIDAWDRLDLWQKKIAGLPDVSRVDGPTDIIRYFESVAGQPRSAKLLGRILDEAPVKNRDGWRHYAADGNHKLRFTAFLTTSDTKRVMDLTRRIEAEAAAALGEGWEATVTGEMRLLAEMSAALVRDEAASVLTAFGVILVLLVLTIRSAPYALLGVVPNLVPIAGLFGLMSVLGIGLNTATAMIASVAIGLVFDNTVYLLYGYREARALGMNADAAVTHALSRRFKPMIASSLILAGGFAVTMQGHMVPTVQFGFLSCATIGLVTFSDLFLVPSLLRIIKPR